MKLILYKLYYRLDADRLVARASLLNLNQAKKHKQFCGKSTVSRMHDAYGCFIIYCKDTYLCFVFAKTEFDQSRASKSLTISIRRLFTLIYLFVSLHRAAFAQDFCSQTN